MNGKQIPSTSKQVPTWICLTVKWQMQQNTCILYNIILWRFEFIPFGLGCGGTGAIIGGAASGREPVHYVYLFITHVTRCINAWVSASRDIIADEHVICLSIRPTSRGWGEGSQDFNLNKISCIPVLTFNIIVYFLYNLKKKVIFYSIQYNNCNNLLGPV